ncbi:cytochrome P450 CYP728D26 [Salvia divinorum]|uniref:Cytochrome P450 CYP728D26 n=1 Tax=Salvia divinorum TaxID=28513 RepID=A0A8E4JAU4_SALDI|nr:cytochrome P450 CYP728D26 [Salvia divinorum]QMS79250.1 cytochrome P450 CYP728D26 [synthetic construct]
MESTIMLWVLAFLPLVILMMKKRVGKRRVPRGTLGIPIIGQTLELLKAMRADKTEEWFQERARKYGPVSKMNIFGKETVFLTGQAYNKFIFSSDAQTLSNNQPASVRRLLGDRNLFEMIGQDHRRLRGAMLSFLKPEALKQYVGTMDHEIRLHLAQHWHHDHVILVMPLMKTLTFNMICTLLFGIERGERRENLVHLFEQMIDGMLSVPLNIPFTSFNKSIRARSEVGAIIRALIHEKREKLERGEAGHDLMTRLLSMCDDAGSPLLSDQEIEDNCVVAMIAGHETTSTLLTFFIKLIVEHPNVYELLLNEHKEIVRGKKGANDPLTWEDLGKMKYTWRIGTEVLRMHPPILYGFRTTVRDIEMEGYVIPKGWQVLWAACMTQLDGSIYPDPHKFNPSRFEDQAAMPPHTFIAFGGGARICPGYEFARMETLAMIHYLVTRFTWKLCLKENTFSRVPMLVFKQGLPIHIHINTPYKSTMQTNII